MLHNRHNALHTSNALHRLQGLMATDSTMLTAPTYAEPTPTEGRRLLVLTGVVAIVGALISAAVSFAILVGVTPITPDNTTTLTLIAVNAGFVLLLIGLIGRELRRIYVAQAARQGGVAPACAHRHHVRAGRGDPGHHGRRRRLDHARHRPRPLVRDPDQDDHQLVAVDRRRSMSRRMPAICRARRCRWPTTSASARSLYSLDRTGFRDLMSQQAMARGLAHAALINRDGSVIIAAQTRADFEMPLPQPEWLANTDKTAVRGEPTLIEPERRNIVGAIVKLRRFSGHLSLHDADWSTLT